MTKSIFKIILNKTNKRIGIIKRTFTFFYNFVSSNLCKALVYPHLEYGNGIWSPDFRTQSVTIERVQRRATGLRSTLKLKDFNYTERLKKLDLPNLKYRRFRGDLIQVYKIINQIDNLKFDKKFTQTKSDVMSNAEYKLYVEYSKTSVGKLTSSN